MASMMALHALPGIVSPRRSLDTDRAAAVAAKEKYPITQMFEIAQARGIYVDTPERNHSGMDTEQLMLVLADAGVTEEFEV